MAREHERNLLSKLDDEERSWLVRILDKLQAIEPK
jgi:hypothetical protein